VLVEVPLTAFTAAGRAEIEALAKRGEMSKPPAAATGKVEGVPKVITEELVACATAAEASDVCTLALADPTLSASARQAVKSRRAEFEARAQRGEIRFGSEWVLPEVARQAAEKAAGHISRAAEMMRVGNLKLVDEELHKASQADPASGQADFLFGLAFMMRNRPDYDEARSRFEEVLKRQPANGPAWNNLAVCEAQQRKYTEAVEAFCAAAELLANREAVISNLAILIRLSSDRRSRISPKELDAITSLYHKLVNGGGGPAGAAATSPVVLSPAGVPMAVGASFDLSSMLSPPAAMPTAVSRDLVGVVVAPNIVLCAVPKDATPSGGFGVTSSDGRNLPAQRIAATPDGAFLLVKCQGIDVTPLPLAPAPPKQGESATVVELVPPDPGHAVVGVAVTALANHAAVAGRPRFVVDVGVGGEATLAGPGTLVLDVAGRLAGLGTDQPRARRTAGARRLVIPVAVVLSLLEQSEESLGSQPESDDAPKLTAPEAAARSQGSVVRVLTGQPITPTP
jgi:hypothetical protein